MSEQERWNTIEDVRDDAVVCCRCDLCYGRTHVVFGEGPVPAGIMIVGEGPGADEDNEGRPFVGRAGKMLDKVLGEAGISRNEFWITNIVRCRPTSEENGRLRNRAPRMSEINACDIWTNQTYRFISPKVVVCLGGMSAKALISRDFRIGEGRGRLHDGRHGIPATATYHPAYVLRLRGDDRRSIEAQMVADFSMVREHLAGSREAA